MKKFKELKIKKEILKAIEDLNFDEMTKIQEESIEYGLDKKDILAQAPTGTGKTLAFLIPILNNINSDDKTIDSIIIAPTRELAIQINDQILKLSKYLNVKSLLIYGGQSIENQIRDLKRKPNIIIGTPGRIIDHLNRKTLKIENIKYLVLDEADEMLNMGFKEDIDNILTHINTNPQIMLFSATIPNQIKEISKNYLKNPKIIKVDQKVEKPEITEYYLEVKEHDKVETLSRLIDYNNYNQTIIFCRTKSKVDDLNTELTKRGYKVDSLHGDLKQNTREKVMQKFKDGIVKILIATDVAARGIDIDGIDVVFNFDIPDDVEYYTHRIGRTARAGKKGISYLFIKKSEYNKLRIIEKETNNKLLKGNLPNKEDVIKNKIFNLLNDSLTEINNPNLIKIRNEVNEMLQKNENFNEIDIISTLILKLTNDELYKENKIEENIDKNNTVRLFLNIGKKDNANKKSLVKFILSNSNIFNEDILDISLMNTFSFLTINKKKKKEIFNLFNNNKYNNKKVSIEEAKKIK